MSRTSPHFFKVRLELERETHHPGGESEAGYEFVAPLDGEGRIDAARWGHNTSVCPVRFFTGLKNRHGILAQGEDGEWFFDYDPAHAANDEYGYRFGRERFVRGRYVSMVDTIGKAHTYRVVQVERP